MFALCWGVSLIAGGRREFLISDSQSSAGATPLETDQELDWRVLERQRGRFIVRNGVARRRKNATDIRDVPLLLTYSAAKVGCARYRCCEWSPVFRHRLTRARLPVIDCVLGLGSASLAAIVHTPGFALWYVPLFHTTLRTLSLYGRGRVALSRGLLHPRGELTALCVLTVVMKK
jgi:hypothetical protein